MSEVFEVSYENTEGLTTKRYRDINDIMLDFGLTKREISAYYSNMSKPKIDCVVKSINKVVESKEEAESQSSNILVVFE